LAVRTRESSRYLLFDKKNDLTGWENTKTGERIISSVPGKKHVRQAFSGIHIVDPGIFKYFPSDNVFPIMELYLSLIEHRTIKGYNHDNTFWFDIGTPEKLDRTRKYFK
ncbi:MAG: nucleotidyltransferase family protein, partial [Bacteroidales bacterium]|nr:nucleotidyltransferase family protein [Bacteroidales bacterium]